MKDETARPQSEMDVLKFFIWLMLVMTVALGVFIWLIWRDLDATRRNLQQGTAWLKDFQQNASEIQSMMVVHKNNKEDEARSAPNTWFSTIWRRYGIQDFTILSRAWIVPPYRDPRGRFVEERIDMDFPQKPTQGSPLPKQSIVEFLHGIEKSSTRQRVIELDLRRVDKDNFDTDAWAGKAMVGYRYVGAKER